VSPEVSLFFEKSYIFRKKFEITSKNKNNEFLIEIVDDKTITELKNKIMDKFALMYVRPPVCSPLLLPTRPACFQKTYKVILSRDEKIPLTPKSNYDDKIKEA